MDIFELYKNCKLCPRQCGVDRNVQTGFCNATATAKIARSAIHMWEEPCISGIKGSGTVFFSNCNLQCVYCQNYQITANGYGREIPKEKICELFLDLQNKGANNINLVTPTIWVPHIISSLEKLKGKLKIPVVYNTSGYETLQTLELLKNYVDIFLTDIKYYSSDISTEFSCAENYFEYSIAAAKKMVEITGEPSYNKSGIMQKGTIIRHMVLPNCYKDSISVLQKIAEEILTGRFVFSLMSQYTPHHKAMQNKKLNRCISSFEYNKVLDTAMDLGLTTGYMQKKISATKDFIPTFDLTGL